MDSSGADAPENERSAPRAGFLHRLGLHRPELRAWAAYDLANSAFVTIIMTAVFPIYYARVAASGMETEQAEFRFVSTTSVAMVIIAMMAPLLGIIADKFPIKKRLLAFFLALGVISTAMMYFIQRGDWLLALTLFFLANIGANGSFVFYDSLLPHIAREEEMDRVSTAGYALGYIGGGVLLAVNLLWIQKPEWFGLPHGEGLSEAQQTFGTRLAFLSVAVWWLLFSIPLFRRVKEPKISAVGERKLGGKVVLGAFRQLGTTFRELKTYKHAFLMLVAFLIYNDGIGTIIRVAALYATGINIPQQAVITAILLTQFVGVPFAFLFGALAGRIGAKQAIFLSLVVYTIISVIGYFMKTAGHFLTLAILVGMVQGGAQALSRSLFASLIPRQKSGEFFGFFAVVEKFAGIIGPMFFAAVLAAGGTSRTAILAVIAFFVVGGILLFFVNVNEGQRLAREAEKALG